MSKIPSTETFIASAEADWLVIRNNLAAESKPWSMIAFHAQQAAEKYLKAYLITKNIRPIRTHDLIELLDACLRFDESLAWLEDDCDHLTDFASDNRYEDFIELNTEQIARPAIAASERICNAIRERITDGSEPN